jgi:hypothetical protein
MTSVLEKSTVVPGLLGLTALVTGHFASRQPTSTSGQEPTMTLLSATGMPLSSIFEGAQSASLTADQARRMYRAALGRLENGPAQCGNSSKPGFLLGLVAWITPPSVQAFTCAGICDGHGYQLVDTIGCGDCPVEGIQDGGPWNNAALSTTYLCDVGECCGWDICSAS